MNGDREREFLLAIAFVDAGGLVERERERELFECRFEWYFSGLVFSLCSVCERFAGVFYRFCLRDAIMRFGMSSRLWW